MSQTAISFAVLYGLVLAGLAASLLAVFMSYRLTRSAGERAKTGRAECDAALESMRKEVAAYAKQLLEIRQEPGPEAAVPVIPKPGLNLSKRSQALRMHRRGDAPEQIAGALEIPLQEVDLLLKVHRIVIGSI
jgi:hypothetical protein